MDFVFGIGSILLWETGLWKYITTDIPESVFWKGTLLRQSPPQTPGHVDREAPKHTDRSFTESQSGLDWKGP